MTDHMYGAGTRRSTQLRRISVMAQHALPNTYPSHARYSIAGQLLAPLLQGKMQHTAPIEEGKYIIC
jgi:hypothetical protein